MKRILIVCAALLLCGVAVARGRGVHPRGVVQYPGGPAAG